MKKLKFQPPEATQSHVAFETIHSQEEKFTPLLHVLQFLVIITNPISNNRVQEGTSVLARFNWSSCFCCCAYCVRQEPKRISLPEASAAV
jgi:hypothetical protein